MTLLLGVVGAVVGGFLGSVLFHVGLQGFFNITTWLLAIGGAVVVLLLYSVFARGARRA